MKVTRSLLLLGVVAHHSVSSTAFSIHHNDRPIKQMRKDHHGENWRSMQQLPSSNVQNIREVPELMVKTTVGMTGGNSEPARTKLQELQDFASKNSFLLGMATAVSFARTFPFLGANGSMLKPELFFGKYGVTCIFLLSGLSLELSELRDAFANMKLNLLVQLTSFLAWPFLLGVPIVSTMKKIAPNLLPPALLDGILILTCLPTTVNMCVILTGSAGGNVASALCNAVIGNMMGIFATPALLMSFFGTVIELPFLEMVVKLCNKVLLPVAIGQVLRTTQAKNLYNNNKKKFKSLQELILIGLVWNAFSNAFTKGLGIGLNHGLVLLCLLPSMHLGSMFVLFKLFSLKVLDFSKRDAVAAMFCASHKTLAFGLPLVNTIFEGNPNLAAYCAPIMFIHPLQLVFGSLLTGKFAEYTASENED